MLMNDLVIKNDLRKMNIVFDQAFFADLHKNNIVHYNSVLDANGQLIEVTTMLHPFQGYFFTIIEGLPLHETMKAFNYYEALELHRAALERVYSGLEPKQHLLSFIAVN